MNVHLVPVGMVDQVWPKVADYLDKSLVHAPDTSMGWLWTECRAGNAYLFAAYDETEVYAASVWRFETWRTGVKFKCLALGGRHMKRWLRMMEQAVRQVAKAGGANGMPYEGRPGWERLFGARKIRAVYEVDLT